MYVLGSLTTCSKDSEGRPSTIHLQHHHLFTPTAQALQICLHANYS